MTETPHFAEDIGRVRSFCYGNFMIVIIAYSLEI